jgi:hypothetical protein
VPRFHGLFSWDWDQRTSATARRMRRLILCVYRHAYCLSNVTADIGGWKCRDWIYYRGRRETVQDGAQVNHRGQPRGRTHALLRGDYLEHRFRLAPLNLRPALTTKPLSARPPPPVAVGGRWAGDRGRGSLLAAGWALLRLPSSARKVGFRRGAKSLLRDLRRRGRWRGGGLERWR